jgi:hypothetical protein
MHTQNRIIRQPFAFVDVLNDFTIQIRDVYSVQYGSESVILFPKLIKLKTLPLISIEETSS